MRLGAPLVPCLAAVIVCTPASVSAEASHDTASCQHYTTAYPNEETYDVYLFRDLAERQTFLHCSSVWPNEKPHIALYPSPVGCLRGDSQFTMDLPSEFANVNWLSEFDEPLGLEVTSTADLVNCETVSSITVAKGDLIIVGTKCAMARDLKCQEKGFVKPTASCAREESHATVFGQETGFHRTLDVGAAPITGAVAFQWLPHQLFAEIDELERKTPHSAFSVSVKVNIENPSEDSPSQVVMVVPELSGAGSVFPVHTRVNPPSWDERTFTIHVPTAVWMVEKESTNGCAIESVQWHILLNLPQFNFLKHKRLVRTKGVKDHYAVTAIPVGNPEDLDVAVATAAISAVVGFLSIVFSSYTRK